MSTGFHCVGRLREIINACLDSDAREVCQTSLIPLFITLYDTFGVEAGMSVL